MKKFTAIMLAALMLIVCIPFAVFAETDYVEIDTVTSTSPQQPGPPSRNSAEFSTETDTRSPFPQTQFFLTP